MTQQNRARRASRPGFACLAALVLTALTLCTVLSARPVQAAEWMLSHIHNTEPTRPY